MTYPRYYEKGGGLICPDSRQNYQRFSIDNWDERFQKFNRTAKRFFIKLTRARRRTFPDLRDDLIYVRFHQINILFNSLCKKFEGFLPTPSFRFPLAAPGAYRALKLSNLSWSLSFSAPEYSSQSRR